MLIENSHLTLEAEMNKKRNNLVKKGGAYLQILLMIGMSFAIAFFMSDNFVSADHEIDTGTGQPISHAQSSSQTQSGGGGGLAGIASVVGLAASAKGVTGLGTKSSSAAIAKAFTFPKEGFTFKSPVTLTGTSSINSYPLSELGPVKSITSTSTPDIYNVYTTSNPEPFATKLSTADLANIQQQGISS